MFWEAQEEYVRAKPDALRDLISFVQFKKRGKTPMEEC